MPSLSSLSTYQDPTFFQPLSQEARTKRAEPEAFAGFDYGLGEKPVPKTTASSAPLATFDDCVQVISGALKRGVNKSYIRQLLSAWGAGTAAQLPPACRASFIDALRNVNVAQPKKAPVDGIYDNRATGKREHWVGGRCVRIVSSEAGLVNWGAYPDLPC